MYVLCAILVTVSCVLQEEKTPLHHAAEDGHMETLRLFLRDYHADVAVSSTVSKARVSFNRHVF